MRIAVVSLLAFALAVASGVSAAAGSAGPSRLERRADTCAPQASEYLYSIEANNEHKLGWRSHYSDLRLDTAVNGAKTDQDNWSVVAGTNATVFRFEEHTAEKCAVGRGKNEKVGLGDCSSAAAEWAVICLQCGTTACGDPYATGCWIRSTTVPGQCAFPHDKEIVTAACSATDTKNIWAFYLS
ncbi:hypothetical protein JCM1841_002289 [Sporobolomyces salmonicolor]